MIDIFLKSGFVYAGKNGHKICKRVIAFTMLASRFRWTKSMFIGCDITRFKLEATAVIFALNHIKDKFRKKDIRVYTDSHFLAQVAQRDSKSGQFVYRTKLEAVEWMRDTVLRFPSLRFVRLNKEHPAWKQTVEIYEDCGFNDVTVDRTE